MNPTFETILTLVQKGTSVQFSPETLSLTNVRRIIQEAAKHHGCTVTLHATDAFSHETWQLFAEDANGHLTVIFG
ncbi:MAG: hypothetical protein IJ626_05200 [Muribaculaceae bacterium]|nr:hypothetical protein [Muribaculaceae bacterium]